MLKRKGKNMRVQRSNFGMDNAFTYQLHEEKYNFHLHIHQFVELTLVLRGELEVSVAGRAPEVARAGDFILIFPFQTHKYSSDIVNKFVIYTFSPSLMSDFISSLGGKVGERAVFRASDSTYNLFTAKLIDGEDFGIFSVRSCLYAMASDFTREVSLLDSSSDNGALEKLVSYMNENYSGSIPLVTAAKDIGYSANYLSHCIKRSFSFGYPTLLACIRIEKAKPLVIEGNKTSLEISLECGFGSERTFNRQFKQITGLTPGEYKKTNKMTVINKGLITDYSIYERPQFPIKGEPI